MDSNMIIVVLILVFGIILLALLGYFCLSTFLAKKKDVETENKPIEEKQVLNDLEKSVNMSNNSIKSMNAEEIKDKPTQNQNSNPPRNDKKTQPKQQTREQREKQTNPFGVDMSKRLYKTDKSNPNNKFIK